MVSVGPIEATFYLFSGVFYCVKVTLRIVEADLVPCLITALAGQAARNS
jgi:hypothetical protein